MKDPSLKSTTPRLTRRAEFEAILSDYQLSEEGAKVLRTTRLVVLIGPTAGGRNTVMAELMKTGKYHFMVSDTTRPPRQNNGVWERNGVEYFFRTEDEMLEELEAGLFVEAEIIHSQQVSGTSVRELQKARDEGKIALEEVEILGSLNMARLKPDATFVYLVPPSFEEWLRRINGRTQLSNEELRNRLNGAIKNFSLALEQDFFKFIVNEDKQVTAKLIDELVNQGVLHDDQPTARRLVRSLLVKTEEFLKQI
jgi:guanylate kinase